MLPVPRKATTDVLLMILEKHWLDKTQKEPWKNQNERTRHLWTDVEGRIS